jgi:hypothetical protein
MFAHLRETEAPKVDAPRPVDITPECCVLMEKLMLAQAQVGGASFQKGGLASCSFGLSLVGKSLC